MTGVVCKHCDAFREVVPIRLPQDFYAIQEQTLAALKMGVLRIVSGDLGWSDVIECELACVHCGARFELDCETYYGSGGRWQPAEPGAASDPAGM